jgi:hypothetical protein
MQDGSIAEKVVSSMELLKAIINIDSYCCNNQENYGMESHTWENLIFLIKTI